MPDPVALMIVSTDGQNQSVALLSDLETLGSGKLVGLYTKEQLAPTKVPLIDQHDQFVGYEFRRPDFYQNAEGYRDEDDVIWTQPTAEAYAKVCSLNHFHRERVAQMTAAIAEAADLFRSYERHHRGKIQPTPSVAWGDQPPPPPVAIMPTPAMKEANEKAERNRVMAEKLERLIDPSFIVLPGGLFGGHPDHIQEADGRPISAEGA